MRTTSAHTTMTVRTHSWFLSMGASFLVLGWAARGRVTAMMDRSGGGSTRLTSASRKHVSHYFQKPETPFGQDPLTRNIGAAPKEPRSPLTVQGVDLGYGPRVTVSRGSRGTVRHNVVRIRSYAATHDVAGDRGARRAARRDRDLLA